jgi:NTE family protein
MQFGTELRSSFNGEGVFNVKASLLKTGINSWNGEWRTSISVGVEPAIKTDFYQPLGNEARWFAGTSALLDQFNINVFQAGTDNIEEQFGIKRLAGSIYGGREFGTWGRGILTYARGRGERSIRVGDPNTPDQDFDIGVLSFSLEVDELDDLYFPTHGHTVRATYKTNQTSLGSDQDYDQALLRGSIVRSWDRHTLEGGIDYRTTVSGVAPPESSFRGGGLFNFSGYEFNQLSGQHYGRLIGTYRRELLQIGLGDVWAGTSIEYGNVWQNRDDIDFGDGLFSGSVFLGAQTVLGPIFLGYGLAEGGASSLYLYLGPVRDGPALQ